MEINELLHLVVERVERLSIRYFITGSIASITYGDPRFTNDIDIVLDLKPAQIDAFLQSFPEEEFYCSEEAVRLAVRERFSFNLLHPESGLKVDFILPPSSDYAASEFQRARRVTTEDQFGAVYLSPEDLIINKLIFFRDGGSEKHPRDILGVLRVQGGNLDRGYVAAWCGRLGLASLWDAVLLRESQSPS